MYSLTTFRRSAALLCMAMVGSLVATEVVATPPSWFAGVQSQILSNTFLHKNNPWVWLGSFTFMSVSVWLYTRYYLPSKKAATGGTRVTSSSIKTIIAPTPGSYLAKINDPIEPWHHRKNIKNGETDAQAQIALATALSLLKWANTKGEEEERIKKALLRVNKKELMEEIDSIARLAPQNKKEAIRYSLTTHASRFTLTIHHDGSAAITEDMLQPIITYSMYIRTSSTNQPTT